jgi:iron(III) transport system permease protein
VATAAAVTVRARRLDADRVTAVALLAGVGLPLVVFVLYPLAAILGKSFETPAGLGLENYVRYFGEPRLTQIIGQSLAVSTVATLLTIVLAYAFAYPLHRARLPGAPVFRVIALLPLFAPRWSRPWASSSSWDGTASSTGPSASGSTSTASGGS